MCGFRGCGWSEHTSTLLTIGHNLDFHVGVIYRADTHWLVFASGFKRGGLSSRAHGYGRCSLRFTVARPLGPLMTSSVGLAPLEGVTLIVTQHYGSRSFSWRSVPFTNLTRGASTNAAANTPQVDGAYGDASDCTSHSAVSIFRAKISLLCVLYLCPSNRKQ